MLKISEKKYLQDQYDECYTWFDRMSFPDNFFKEKRVLDFGCGNGALGFFLLNHGISSYIGVDISLELIDQARQAKEENFFSILGDIDNCCKSIDDFKSDEFDVIVCKDSFEHIINLNSFAVGFQRILKPNGVIATGFSPLYFSPWGDHGRIQLRLPWIHAFLPLSLIKKKLRFFNGINIDSVEDLGMNMLTPSQFRYIFSKDMCWSFVQYHQNRKEGVLIKVFDFLSSVAFLEKYFVVNIYAIIKNEKNSIS